MEESANTIPQQETGRSTDFTEEKQFESLEAAHEGFRRASGRMLSVNEWYSYAGAGSSAFCLTNNQGEQVNGFAQEGLLISIDLPFPGSNAGDGLEWVIIERVEAKEDAKAAEEFVSMTVRPIPDPHKAEAEIAHFYNDASTNTFIVKRTGTTVSAEAHGRNETPNNEDVNLHDKVRNTVIALTARIGLAGPQWKKLVKGLL